MASYTELLQLKSTEIAERAREQEIEGRGSMNKIETVAALADEDIGPLIGVLDQKKSELLEVAEDLGVDTEGTKADLQVRIAKDKLTDSGDSFPNSGTDGDARKPRENLSSHFDTTERRREAVMSAAHKALDRAMQEGQSYVVLESLRPKDATEPLSVQPSYMKHHPDEFPVVEITVPHTAYRVHKAERNPIRMSQD